MYDRVLNSTKLYLFFDKMEEFPEIEDAKTLAEGMDKPCLVPLVATELDISNPSELFLSLRRNYDLSYFLESMGDYRHVSRYSVIGLGSLLHFRYNGSEMEIEGRDNLKRLSRNRLENLGDDFDPLRALRKAMFIEDMQILGLDLPRYVLGVTGYLAYDYVYEDTISNSEGEVDSEEPILEFVLPETVIVFDHKLNQTYYASLMVFLEESNFETVHERAISRLKNLTSIMREDSERENKEFSVDTNFEKSEFEENVKKIKKYIRSGEVIQTVLSRSITLTPSPNLDDFYLNLRRINPSPYMFFLDFSNQKIVGSSPEALVRVEGEEVMTRPIAGTRRRGESEEDDFDLETELINDEKERAEHVMLVDLGRNDIGKVSKFGSVSVPDFMNIEKYGDVQHIVSTVTGELKKDFDSIDALKALFPAGTVTGAPKVRAMEIIDELEPTKRGIYSGSVGSISYTGDADFAITIRTLTSTEEKAQIQVGAGIVADSDPEEEFFETQNKARSLLRAAGVEDENSSDR